MDILQKDVRTALDFDPLAEAEKVTGQSYKDSADTAALGFILMAAQNEQKAALLHLTRDTDAFNQTLEEWMAVVQDLGFELVLCDDIPGTEDKYRIWWQKEHGMLLSSDSYWGDKSVNSATVYFNYRFGRDKDSAWSALVGCSHSPTDFEGIRSCSYGEQQGLRLKLQELLESGELLPKWKAVGFLWLLHYRDTKVEGYDYEAITKERVSRLPAEVQEAIACVHET